MVVHLGSIIRGKKATRQANKLDKPRDLAAGLVEVPPVIFQLPFHH